jgi:hypothetical protein
MDRPFSKNGEEESIEDNGVKDVILFGELRHRLVENIEMDVSEKGWVFIRTGGEYL